MGQQGLLEVVVVDDGSTDDTAEAVLRYAKEIEDRRSKIGATEGAAQQTTGRQFATAPEAHLPATRYSPPVTTGLPLLRLIRHEVSAGYIVRRNEGAR